MLKQRKIIAVMIPLAALCLLAPGMEGKAAETTNGVTYTDNNNTYSVVIPTEVVIRDANKTENLTLSVTTKPNCNVEILVKSKNDYHLTNEDSGNYSIKYEIPEKDKSLVFSNEESENKTQDYSIGVSVTEQAVYSGEYTDQLTFVLTGKNYPSGTHRLSFDMNCTDSIYTGYKLLNENDPYGVLPTPERDGYAFDGWYTDKTDGTKVSSNTQMGSEPVTVYAHWTPYTLTINYHNGGAEQWKKYPGDQIVKVKSNEDIIVQIENVAYDQAYDHAMYGILDVGRLTRSGYSSGLAWKVGSPESEIQVSDENWNEYKEASDKSIFNGRYVAEFIGVLGKLKKGNVTVDLYPIWNANKYTVAYDPSDENVTGTTAESTHTYDVEKELTPNGFKREGYTFAGWSTDARATEAFYKDKALVKNLTETNNATVTLYAVWEANTDTVQYNPNSDEASGSMESSVHTYGIEQSLSLNEFTREGYLFTSWNDEADGTGTSYADGSLVKNLTTEDKGTIILYAQWEPGTYTVQYDPNSDDEVWGSMEPAIYTYGTAQKLASNEFVRDGYLFMGWNEAADGTGTAYDDEEEVKDLTDQQDGIVTLYAQWEEDDSMLDLDDELEDDDLLATPNNAERADPDDIEDLDIEENLDAEEDLDEEEKEKDIDEDEDLDKENDKDDIKSDDQATGIPADDESKQPQDNIGTSDSEDTATSDTDPSEDDKNSDSENASGSGKDTTDPSEPEPDPDPEEPEQETEENTEEDTKEEDESEPEPETADVARSKDDFETE